MDKKIGSDTDVHVTNVFDPTTFQTNFVSCNVRLSKIDMEGDDEYIRKLFDEVATEVINYKNKNE